MMYWTWYSSMVGWGDVIWRAGTYPPSCLSCVLIMTSASLYFCEFVCSPKKFTKNDRVELNISLEGPEYVTESILSPNCLFDIISHFEIMLVEILYWLLKKKKKKNLNNIILFIFFEHSKIIKWNMRVWCTLWKIMNLMHNSALFLKLSNLFFARNFTFIHSFLSTSTRNASNEN